ncbi:MAG: FapA family protein [Methylococcaceae bacterium]|nr:FapA family protein [Methylococcaceae bacterium]
MTDVLLTDVLTFKLNDEGKLLAEFEALEDKPPLDKAAIEEALAKQGFSHLYLHENSLSRLVTQYSESNENFVLEIGERRDGRCIIDIDADRMIARLTLEPPCGGHPVNLAQVEQALQEKGVVYGVMIPVIEAALKERDVKDRIIAKGQPPEPGVDAQFQSLLPEMRERKPLEDEHGNVDYRELGGMIVVKQGSPLMRRTPPTAGKNGQDVTGQVLSPKAGKDVQFSSRLQGAQIDPGDNNLLLASITGQPKLAPNGVTVDPTISVKVVDISTGNVSFDGAIIIKGDVKEGMKVHASGDVFVGGTVEAAEIEAGGDIVIKGGVIGHSEHTADPKEAPIFNARVVSKGSISTRYAENVYMEAGVDINIEEYSMHNHLVSLNQIVVGKPGGKKGRIIGGFTCATALVWAAKIGSNAGFITKIRVGFNPLLHARLDKLKRMIEANEKELEDIKKVFTFISAHPEKNKNDLLDKAINTKEKLENDNAQLHADLADLHTEMTLAEQVQVIVDDTVYSGVEIQIGNHFWRNNLDRGKGAFQLVESEIIYGSIGG